MITKDDLLAAATAMAARLGARPCTMALFCGETGIGQYAITRHFGSWKALCKAAGLGVRERVTNDQVFAAMRDAFLACGGIVGRNAFLARFAYSENVLLRRFGGWANTLAQFHGWAAANDPAFPYLNALAARVAELAAARQPPRPGPLGPPWPSLGGRACGERLIDLPALLFAPTNEIGVVVAFAMTAERLGYAFESIGQEFPDCIAKRLVGEGRWETVRIEFEFRARNFLRHGHDLEGCDVIVCWENDWPDCPIEVLELKSRIAALGAPGQGVPL
jgi:hypothetical protein